jgi:hypothetical protein
MPTFVGPLKNLLAEDTQNSCSNLLPEIFKRPHAAARADLLEDPSPLEYMTSFNFSASLRKVEELPSTHTQTGA